MIDNRPSKIVCVGRSYAAHAKELGNAIPTRPVLFIKPPSSLATLEQGVRWNQALGSCHYECELSLRIDKPLTAVTDPAQALAAIGAVTLGLDLTLRDLQHELKTKGEPWERAKAFDGSCLLADWVDVSKVGEVSELTYTFALNDLVRQQGDMRLLLFPLGQLLCDMSQAFTLEQGDVVMTGTPAGVGALAMNDILTMTLFAEKENFVWKTHVKGSD